MAIPFALFASLAPIAIRAAGKLFGGDVEKAADVVATVVEGGGNEADVERATRALPAEVQVRLGELANEAKRIDAQREGRRLEHTETLQGQIQQTAQAEQQHGTAYTKETRPKIARQSWWAGTVLTFALAGLDAAGELSLSDIHLVLLGIAYGPCFQYLGVRTVDKWLGKTGTTV